MTSLPNPTPLENESPQAFRAFKAYVQLGRKRSIVAVDRRMAVGRPNGKPLCRSLLTRWSAKYRWQSRLAELTARAAIEENERRAQADAEAKKEVAQQIERERLRFVQRQITASEAITQRALEILRLPIGDTKPDAAAKLFAVAYTIGGHSLNLPGAAPFDLQPTGQRQQVNIVIQRDDQSDRVAKVYADFFSQPENSGHAQAQRFVREYRELVAERAALGLQPVDEDAPQLPDGANGEEEQDDDEIRIADDA
jgi:hypothetical protein